MKKILSLALVGAMMVSAIPAAYAAENEADYTAGTQISMLGSQEEAAGGAGEYYTVTVPALMSPGDTSTVKAEGMWASNKVLAVTNPSTVQLTYGSQSFTANINGAGMILPGNNTASVSNEETIKVSKRVYDSNEDAVDILFGTWTGRINYTVSLIEATNVMGDANGDGIINHADVEYILQVVTGTVTLTDEEKAAVLARSDMNGDGYIDSTDSTSVGRILSGQNTIA